MSIPKYKTSVKILFFICLMLVLALGGIKIKNHQDNLSNAKLGDTTTAKTTTTSTKNTNVVASANDKDTTLSGVVNMGVCGGAQPNYPEPPSCTAGFARRKKITLTNNAKVVTGTRTDDSGYYIFSLEPGSYTLRVEGESDSEGHKVSINSGANVYNFMVTMQTP